MKKKTRRSNTNPVPKLRKSEIIIRFTFWVVIALVLEFVALCCVHFFVPGKKRCRFSQHGKEQTYGKIYYTIIIQYNSVTLLPYYTITVLNYYRLALLPYYNYFKVVFKFRVIFCLCYFNFCIFLNCFPSDTFQNAVQTRSKKKNYCCAYV